MVSVNESFSNLKEYTFKPYTLKEHKPKGRSKNRQIPKGRSGHRIVSDNSFIYSFGGFNPFIDAEERPVNGGSEDLTLFKELWRYNIASREWKKLEEFSSSLPRQLASNAVVMKGSLLIVHGGTGVPFGFFNSNETYVADLKHNTSLKLLKTEGKLPNPQYGQAMVIDGHCLYVIGGTTGYEFSADVHCLNLKTRIWEETYISKGLSYLEPEGRYRHEDISRGLSFLEPEGRYRHEVALYNSKIIIFGGGTDNSTFEFEQLPAFNILEKKWELLLTIGDSTCDGSTNNPCFPAARRCHGSVQIPEDELQDPEYIICGGYDGVKIFSDMWKLNLRTLQWSKCNEDLIFPLYFHSSSLSPCGQMFIFGGICEIPDEDDTFTVRTNKIFSTWVRMPKLSEICWDAILYYNPSIVRCSKEKLLNCGVPKEFVERIES